MISDRSDQKKRRSFTPLLPKSGSPPIPVPQQSVLPRKRRAVLAACAACRQRKSKCSGERPTCYACGQNKTACFYTGAEDETPTRTLKRQVQELDDENKRYRALFALLKTRDPQDWGILLQRMQNGEDLNAIAGEVDDDLLDPTPRGSRPESLPESLGMIKNAIASAQGSMHSGLRPSDYRANRSLMPRTSSDFEFELSALHQIAYPVLLPIDASTLGFNPFEKLRFRSMTAFQTDNLASVIGRTGPIQLQDVGLLPYCDPRLKRLSISYWTKIPISDESAAALISVFLENDLTFMGFFDANLFLQDLIDHKERFCSSFLVNSILYQACHAYTSLDIRAASLGIAFYRVAQNLFRTEQSSDSLTNLAAMNILSVGCFASGEEQFALELLGVLMPMAKRMHLYGINSESKEALAFRKLPPDLIRFTSHVAWGTYVWATLRSIYFSQGPVGFSPALPIPGNRSPDMLDLTWPSHPLPRFMGQSFTMLCRFFIMVQEVRSAYYTKDGTLIPNGVPLAFAEKHYRKLLEWTDSLNRRMAWDNESPAHICFFHVIFHNFILDIFRPFIQESGDCLLESFTSGDSTPRRIFDASLNQLKRLVLMYHTHTNTIGHLAYINAGLMQIAHAVLKDTTDESWWYYFMLCIRLWQTIYVGFPVFGGVITAFLSMAVENGAMRSSEAVKLKEELLEYGRHHSLQQDAALTSWTADYDRAMTSPDDARVGAVAQKFNEVVLSEETKEGTDKSGASSTSVRELDDDPQIIAVPEK